MYHHSWKLLDVCIYTAAEVEKYQYLGTLLCYGKPNAFSSLNLDISVVVCCCVLPYNHCMYTLTYINVFFFSYLFMFIRTICLFLIMVKYILQGSVKHFHCDIQTRPKHPTPLSAFRL